MSALFPGYFGGGLALFPGYFGAEGVVAPPGPSVTATDLYAAVHELLAADPTVKALVGARHWSVVVPYRLQPATPFLVVSASEGDEMRDFNGPATRSWSVQVASFGGTVAEASGTYEAVAAALDPRRWDGVAGAYRDRARMAWLGWRENACRRRPGAPMLLEPDRGADQARNFYVPGRWDIEAVRS
jgi:hypothetical protein